jgi:hypothetical protein
MIKDRTTLYALLQKTDSFVHRFLHFSHNKKYLYEGEEKNDNRLCKMIMIMTMPIMHMLNITAWLNV